MTPTPEQSAILEAARDPVRSLMIRAGAGCGKTTTLELLAKSLPPDRPGVALAFNVRIAKALAERFPPNWSVRTLNSLGAIAWQRAHGRGEVDPRKLGRLVTRTLREADYSADREEWALIRELASRAQNAGLVPLHYPQSGLRPDTAESWREIAFRAGLEASDTHIALARQALIANIAEALRKPSIVSYDDQIYLSALFGGQFPRYPELMVDEAQDLSPLNLIQIRRTAAGRIIAVGDERQAIYQWRGADSEAMERLRGLRPQWQDLPLMTTFRCPRAVVARQQEHAPDFRAAEGAPHGQVVDWTRGPGPTKGTPWSLPALRKAAGGTAHIAVLCRNNAPLVALALKFIKQRQSCHMIGREIGSGMLSLATKLYPDNATDAEAGLALLTQWQHIEEANAGEDERKLDAISDRADCLRAMWEQDSPPRNAGDLKQQIRDLAASEGGIELSSIHRAKGLEWPVVVHLDPWRIPSRRARTAAEIKQELNLRYVAETRAMAVLILASLGEFT